ncbi:MAG TPA: cyclic nucleotide-binding domain-containing protein [Xanthobacteraceae bacterium]|nr:cyclic nucleotide-binding domain-containing protein [Xanthobacteraceae bacterium]
MPEQRAIIGHIAPYLRLLREHQAFGALPEQDLKTLIVHSDLIEFAQGELLLRQGAPSDSVLLIVQGEVDVCVETSQGQVQLGRMSSGALVGEVGVFADLPRTASIRAHTPTQALKIDRDDVLQVGGENLAFLRAVLAQLGERIATFNQTIGDYTDVLAELEQRNFDPSILDHSQPLPEFVGFAQSLRRMVERIGLRKK